MKKIIPIFLLATFSIFINSCGDTVSPDLSGINSNISRANSLGGNSITEAETILFNGKELTFNTSDILELDINQEATNLVNAFLAADKIEQTLEVSFTMDNKPVEDGIFVFGIETEDAKTLTLEIFDEEGFNTVASNQFEITTGNNYKALNVNALTNGSYTFRLKDKEGKELQRVLEIKNK